MAKGKSSETKKAPKKSTPAPTEISLTSDDPNTAKPRLKRLIITNFRSITSPVTVDLDDIVVLVGAVSPEIWPEGSSNARS